MTVVQREGNKGRTVLESEPEAEGRVVAKEEQSTKVKFRSKRSEFLSTSDEGADITSDGVTV